MTQYIEILPKLDASVAIDAKDFVCPECRKSAISGFNGEVKPKLVGWCDTDWGYMMIVECPLCFEKYRFHGTSLQREKHNLDAFNHAIHLYVLANYFSNTNELKQKADESTS